MLSAADHLLPYFLTSMTPLISVIVCTYNRSSSMVRAVRSTLRQQFAEPGGFEVLVIDDRSRDNTAREFASQFGGKQGVRYLEGRGLGPTAAYNDGINAARGEWLAFCDDDQEAADGWLHELYATAKAADALVVGGPIALRVDGGAPYQLGRVCRLLYGEYLYPRHAGQPPLPPGGNRLIAREIVDTIGLYDERIRSAGADLEFALRARAAAAPMAWAPTALMLHHIRPERLEPRVVRQYAFHAGYSRAVVMGIAKSRTQQVVEGALRLTKALSWDLAGLSAGMLLGKTPAVVDHAARMSIAAGFAARILDEVLVDRNTANSFRALPR